MQASKKSASVVVVAMVKWVCVITAARRKVNDPAKESVPALSMGIKKKPFEGTFNLAVCSCLQAAAGHVRCGSCTRHRFVSRQFSVEAS